MVCRSSSKIMVWFASAMLAHVATTTAGAPVPKQVAAPPSEFLSGALRLPHPARTGEQSRSALLPVDFVKGDAGRWVAFVDLPIDECHELSLLPLHPDARSWDIRITSPPLDIIDLKRAHRPDLSRRVGRIGLSGDDTDADGEVFTLSRPAPGSRVVTIDAPAGTALNRCPDAYLLIASDSPFRLFSYLNTQELLIGRDVGVVSYVFDRAYAADTPAPTPLPVVLSGEMTVYTPDGGALTVPMADDGGHDDGAAGDGVYGGLFRATVEGQHIAQVVVRWATPNGGPFVRTTQHMFSVVEPRHALTGVVTAKADGDAHLNIDLRVSSQSPSQTVQLSAELWGTGPDGDDAPICWLSGMVTPRRTESGLFLSLRSDARWIGLAEAGPPFQLRNVRLQDPSTHIPVSQLAVAAIDLESLPAKAGEKADRITTEMLMGSPPPLFETAPARADQSPVESQPSAEGGALCSSDTLHKVMLVHGYCSEGVWPEGDFTNWIEFADPNQSRPHSVFAQLIYNRGIGLKAYGIIAHSQGGCASLHLYTYYWSGLDFSTGGRRIQSVGTPYQGTPLASNIAILGQIFGVGCGPNDDLTYNGAAMWLAGIPQWARNEVYYYTTSFTNGPGFDYCSLVTDFFLSDPDDGVVEMARGQLPGAYNMGHTEGWCHTSDMRDPPQCTDHARNAILNANANR